MATKRYQMLNSLRRAIQKVKFLLSFNATRWIFSSVIGSSSPSQNRKLSFRRQPSGLLDCTDDECDYNAGSSFVLSRSESLARDTTSPASDITRSTSDASSLTSSDDIDKRAEDFIQSFYRHIQMERQVSLELRYCRGKEYLVRTQSD